MPTVDLRIIKTLNDFNFETRPVDPLLAQRAQLSYSPVTGDTIISGGKYPWFADMVVKNIPVRKGKRYLLKAHFKPAVDGLNYSDKDWRKVLVWRFEVKGFGGQVYPTPSATSPLPEFAYERFLFVVEAEADGEMDVKFILEARLGKHDMRIALTTLSVEEVDGAHSVDAWKPIRPRAKETETQPTLVGKAHVLPVESAAPKIVVPPEPRASVAMQIIISDASLAQITEFAQKLKDIFGTSNVQIMPTRVPSSVN